MSDRKLAVGLVYITRAGDLVRIIEEAKVAGLLPNDLEAFKLNDTEFKVFVGDNRAVYCDNGLKFTIDNPEGIPEKHTLYQEDIFFRFV